MSTYLQMYRGDDTEFDATVSNKPEPLASSDLFFAITRDLNDTPDVLVTSGSGAITILDESAGTIRIAIAGSLTDSFPGTPTNATWALRLRTSGDKVYTLNSGVIRVNPNVTGVLA